MKRIMLAVCAAMVMSMAIGLSAQTRGQAFIKQGPITQEALARALETNNQKVLNADCMKMVAVSIAQGHVPAGSNCKDLAAYVRTLSVVDCPVGVKASLAWVSPAREIMLTGLVREFRNGEKCLLNIQTGIWFASLLCGNFITDDGLPMPGSHETVRPAVSAESLADQAREEARRRADEEELARRRAAEMFRTRTDGPHNFFSLKRKSGKFFWGTAAAAAIGGAVVCSVTDHCKDKLTVKQIVYR